MINKIEKFQTPTEFKSRFSILKNIFLLQLPYTLRLLVISRIHRILFTVDLNSPTKAIPDHFLIFLKLSCLRTSWSFCTLYHSFYNHLLKLILLMTDYVARIAQYSLLNRIHDGSSHAVSVQLSSHLPITQHLNTFYLFFYCLCKGP